MKKVPSALMRIFARSYAVDKTGTEADIQWLLYESRRHSHAVAFSDLESIVEQLKVGYRMEGIHAGNVESDKRETIAVQGKD